MTTQALCGIVNYKDFDGSSEEVNNSTSQNALAAATRFITMFLHMHVISFTLL